jgi:hypothetical protein
MATPWEIARALREMCAAKHISRRQLGMELGASYATVVRWLPRGRNYSRNSATGWSIPGKKWLPEILKRYPDLKEGRYRSDLADLHIAPLIDGARLRKRGIGAEAAKAAIVCAGAGLHRLIKIRKALPQSAGVKLPLKAPDEFVPLVEAQRIRTRLRVGSAPIRSVGDLLEQLGVPVGYSAAAGDGVCSCVLGLSVPAVAVLGQHRRAALLRHELASELGFFLAEHSPLRGAAKKQAVVQFADELLAPLGELLRRLFPTERQRIPLQSARLVAGVFGVPVESIARQCRRITGPNRIGVKATTVEAPPIVSEPPATYLCVLALQAGIEKPD